MPTTKIVVFTRSAGAAPASARAVTRFSTARDACLQVPGGDDTTVIVEWAGASSEDDVHEDVARRLVLARELDRAVQLEDGPALLPVRNEIDADERRTRTGGTVQARTPAPGDPPRPGGLRPVRRSCATLPQPLPGRSRRRPLRGDENPEVVALRRHELLHEDPLLLEPRYGAQLREGVAEIGLVVTSCDTVAAAPEPRLDDHGRPNNRKGPIRPDVHRPRMGHAGTPKQPSSEELVVRREQRGRIVQNGDAPCLERPQHPHAVVDPGERREDVESSERRIAWAKCL